LVLQGQDFSSATWQKINGATVGATVADPFGGNSAFTLIFSSASSSRIEQGSPSAIRSGDVVTVSVYLRADSNTTIFTRLAQESFAAFNVTTSWQRFTYTGIVPPVGLYPQLNNSESGAKTIYAYGFQVERHPTARTYIPTTTAEVYGPRFDHDPVTFACKGLLIEEGRTNLCLQSNAFSTSPWANINSACAISQNETGPDGIANSAWTFTDDSMDRAEGRYLEASLTSGVVYSLSVFVKKTTGTPSTYPAIWLARSGTLGGCVINTTAGTATAITSFSPLTIMSTTASVVDSGNFWRVTSLITPNVTGSWEISISPSGNGNGTGVLDVTATGSAVFWGAQVEAGSFPTSYIPTTTGSVARSADVCNITGGNFSGFYNRPACTVVASFIPATIAAPASVCGAGDPRDIEIQMIGGGNIVGLSSNLGGGTDQLGHSGVVIGASQRFAFASQSSNQAVCLNGGAVLASPSWLKSATAPTLFYIGRAAFGGQYSGVISMLRVYRKRLPNAKLQSLTV
jgi:hypothetical protein